MVLNYIWIAFFLIAFIIAVIRLLAYYFHFDFILDLFVTAKNQCPDLATAFEQKYCASKNVFQSIVSSTFSSSEMAITLAIGYVGAITLWMGIMKTGEKAGAINFLSRIIGPFFSRLFPEIPKNHPAIGEIIMNFSANALGLGNAATPLGLKAMQSMQDLNTAKETASNSQIMFLVLNTAGFTLLPVTIMVFRKQMHAANPTDVFIPILLATCFSTFGGVLITAIRQKINLLDKVLLFWTLGIAGFIATVIYYFHTLPPERLPVVSSIASSVILFTIIASFLGAAFYKKINVFETFIEGAKGGFETAIRIMPYLVAMLVGIAVFRASGSLDLIIKGFSWLFSSLGFNTDFVPALPTALMKPLSGSGANGATIDTIMSLGKDGADTFAGRLSCIIQGSADTTFYIIALYFGSVGIKKTRYAITHGLFTDLFGFIAAILIAYMFFH